MYDKGEELYRKKRIKSTPKGEKKTLNRRYTRGDPFTESGRIRDDSSGTTERVWIEYRE